MSKDSSLVKLPPSEAAFRQHILRVAFQVYVWTHANEAKPPSRSPLEYGWRNENKYLMPKCYGFLIRSEIFFPTTQELKYLFFLSREAQIFFPEFNIRLYDKKSESDFFSPPPPKSEYFFQQHWESEYFFRKKP